MNWLKQAGQALLWIITTLGIIWAYERFIDKPDSQVNNTVGKIKNKSKKGGKSTVDVEMPNISEDKEKRIRFKKIKSKLSEIKDKRKSKKTLRRKK